MYMYQCALARIAFFQIKYMLLAGWEVRIGKNCDRGLENAARGRRLRAAFSSPRSQSFTIRTDPRPVNNLFIFFQALRRKKKLTEKKTHASVIVTVVRDRKIRTALRTNQIAGFVTVPAWKKLNTFYLFLTYIIFFHCCSVQHLHYRYLHVYSNIFQ